MLTSSSFRGAVCRLGPGGRDGGADDHVGPAAAASPGGQDPTTGPCGSGPGISAEFDLQDCASAPGRAAEPAGAPVAFDDVALPQDRPGAMLHEGIDPARSADVGMGQDPQL